MSNRRNFLKMMFGGLAAAVAVPAAPAIVRDLAADFGIRPEVVGPFYTPWSFAQDFDFSSSQSVLTRIPKADFLIRTMGIWYHPKSDRSMLKDALDNTYVEVLSGDKVFFEAPAWMLGITPFSDANRAIMSVPIYPEIKIHSDLKINLNATSGIDCTGASGTLVVQGVRVHRA